MIQHRIKSNIISIQFELMTKKSNTERVQNENKNMTHIDQNQSNLLKKMLKIVTIIHRLTAVTPIQKVRKPW